MWKGEALRLFASSARRVPDGNRRTQALRYGADDGSHDGGAIAGAKAPQFLASHPKQRPNGLCSTFDGTHCSRSGFQGLTSPLKDLSESYAAQIRRLQKRPRYPRGHVYPARKVSFRIARSRIRFAISILTWKTHLSSQKPLTLIQNGFAERHH